MPYEKMPPKPVPKSHRPSNFHAYKVKDGDNWERLANMHSMKPWELIYENFKTRNAAEINWYLKNYVGCSNKTSDGKNWIFSSKARPGIVYVPLNKNDVPVSDHANDAVPRLKNLWAGLAKAHSGDLVIVGAHDLTGQIYNLGDPAYSGEREHPFRFMVNT